MVLEGLLELRNTNNPGHFDLSNYASFVKNPFGKNKITSNDIVLQKNQHKN